MTKPRAPTAVAARKPSALTPARECGDYPAIIAPHYHEPGAKELRYATVITDGREYYQCLLCGFGAQADPFREMFINHMQRHAQDAPVKGPLDGMPGPVRRTAFDDLEAKILAEQTPADAAKVTDQKAVRAPRGKRTSAIMENVKNAKGEFMVELMLPADVMAWKTAQTKASLDFPQFIREAWAKDAMDAVPIFTPASTEVAVRRGVYMTKAATDRLRELEAQGFNFSAWAVATCRAAAKLGQ
jgi:hypothetical protein